MDLSSDEVEFKRDFDFATSVEAIAPLPQKTVLLTANRHSGEMAYFLVVLDSQGSDVAVPALVHQSKQDSYVSTEGQGASLLFDQSANHVIVSIALG